MRFNVNFLLAISFVFRHNKPPIKSLTRVYQESKSRCIQKVYKETYTPQNLSNF